MPPEGYTYEGWWELLKRATADNEEETIDIPCEVIEPKQLT